MLTFLRMRLEAGRLAASLRRSLLRGDEGWRREPGDEGDPNRAPRTELRLGDEAEAIAISIRPRCIRLFDAIYVTQHSSEVWLPLVSRIRLRNAARWYLASQANDYWRSLQSPSETSA